MRIGTIASYVVPPVLVREAVMLRHDIKEKERVMDQTTQAIASFEARHPGYTYFGIHGSRNPKEQNPTQPKTTTPRALCIVLNQPKHGIELTYAYAFSRNIFQSLNPHEPTGALFPIGIKTTALDGIYTRDTTHQALDKGTNITETRNSTHYHLAKGTPLMNVNYRNVPSIAPTALSQQDLIRFDTPISVTPPKSLFFRCVWGGLYAGFPGEYLYEPVLPTAKTPTPADASKA